MYALMIQMRKNGGICPKMYELEQFSSGLAAFSDIHDFSKIDIFKDLGGHFEIPATVTILGPKTYFFFHLPDRYPYFWGPSFFGSSLPMMRNSNLRKKCPHPTTNKLDQRATQNRVKQAADYYLHMKEYF